VLGVYCISPVVVFMFVFPLFGGFVIVMVVESSVPSTSLSFVRISIHVVVSSFVVAVSSFAMGGSLIDIIVRYTVALLDCNVPSDAL